MLTIFLIITSGFAQVNEKTERPFYKQGDWEFCFLTSIGESSGQIHGTNSYSYDSLQNIYPYENIKKSIFINVGVSTGYFIAHGLSVEPELNLNINFEGLWVSILGNLCYTFYLPKKNIYPYIKLGYGLSNNLENDYHSSNGIFESLNFKTINAGAGLKYLYYSSMALKMEINYRNINGSNTYTYSDQYSSSSNKYQSTTSIISLAIGISILL